MSPISARQIEVRRANLEEWRTRETSLAAADGQAVLRIEHFGLSTNNITYAVFGERMRYWDFFPTEADWGVVPVWGYAAVVESRTPDLPEGARLYGYWPMASHAVLGPLKATRVGVVDMAEHRRPLASAYNGYRNVGVRQDGPAPDEPARMLLHPLFATAFLIAEFFAENAFFGAERAILSSASSKTALATAFCLKRRLPDGPTVVGLTSPRNRAFVEHAGFYDQVSLRDDVTPETAAGTAAYIDFAGSGPLLRQVHTAYGEALKYSCMIGATHWREQAPQHDLPGARPTFFFAPDHIEARFKDWGPQVYVERETAAFEEFLPTSERWLKVSEAFGADAAGARYRALLAGDVAPEAGIIAKL